MNANFSLRKAGTRDKRTFDNLVHLIFQEHLAPLNFTYELSRQNAFYWVAELKNPKQNLLKSITKILFSAQPNKKAIGFGGVWVLDDTAEVVTIGTLEKYRNNGVADAILKEIIKVSKRKKVEKINLELRKSNQAALSFYKKHSFEVVGKRKNYYHLKGQNEDATLMTLNLKLRLG